MAILGLLCVFFVHVIHTSAVTVLDCGPRKPENPDILVENCNYYCGQNENKEWKMGYYVNGTLCQHYEGGEGVCLDMGPGTEGCYAKDQDEVRKFYEGTLGTHSTTITPSSTKSRRTKEKSKTPNTPKNKTKPSKVTKKPKSPKKPKKAKKAKKSKKPKTTTPADTEW
uniref:Putative bt 1 n=1 Tax=Amblyomma tuberculatum TaxID=48802 RepID=A0A6M2E756_9ACAR